MGTSGVSEVKLKRFLEHNQRLREHLEMRRIPVSEASDSLIQFVTTTRDALIPSLWGTTGTDPFAKQSTGCCNIS
ncbi:MAG: G-protein gamma-like domain-containing protein [Linnemannia gamsii]|nr:MAG: G-protein gamma-like domain-containing protein [Linnemannia gamsii]